MNIIRKYAQITIVVALLCAIVWLRRRSNESVAEVSVAPPKPTPEATTEPAASSPDVTPTALPTPISTPTPQSSGQYRDGAYTGQSANAYYGYIQIQAKISGGKLVDVIFLDHPSDNRTSQLINGQAMPLLKSEALQAQSAEVDIVSGASASSEAFRQSLASALGQAS